MVEDIDSALRLNPSEQAIFDKQMNVYSIIKTIEFLEFSYCDGQIKGIEYDKEFRDLLN